MTPAARCRLAALLLVAGGSSGCAPRQPESADSPVFDGSRPYRLLVEDSRLGIGPRSGESRFLAGWRPWIDGGRLVLGGDPENARVQVVTLEARPRRLRLELPAAPDRPLTVSATHDGRLVGRGESENDRVEITLSETLAPGVQTITLTRDGDPPPPFDVVGATLAPRLPPGEAAVQGADLRQQGASTVEVFVDAPAAAELVTTFEPPPDATPEQSFTLVASAMDGSTLGSYGWSAASGARSPQAIALPLPAGAGEMGERLVRLRFASLGEGPPARWLGPRLRSGRSVAAAPAVADSGRSREETPPPPRLVVLYVMDALRADFLDAGAGDLPGSPELLQLAGEGLVFDRHRSLAPSTLPSTRALFTGSLRALDAEAPQPRLAEAFRRAGYRTGLFSGNPFVSSELGLDHGFEAAPQSIHFDLHALRMASPYNDNAEVVHAAALEWLDSLPDDSRVFLYVHTMHPHNPYAPPPELSERLVGESASEIDGSSLTLIRIRDQAIPVDETDMARLRALYAASVAYNGVELRRFLDRLEERFEPRDTLLVLTSDHGEELFDHDGVLHGYTLYEEQLRIPLVVRWPGRVHPGRTERHTTTLDLRRSLLELLDAEDHGPLAGRSLLPLLVSGADEASWDDRTLVAAAPDVRGGMLAVREGPWKLVFAGAAQSSWGMGQGRGRTWEAEYLFHLGRDPEERVNLVGHGGLREAWLRTRLELWSATLEASGTAGDEPSEELRRRLESLGYLE